LAKSLTAFIDDSKDALEAKFFVAAGVVGLKEDWNIFNKRWAKVLSEAPSIEYFHAIEWRGFRKQFAQFRENGRVTEQSIALANAKRNALLDVIRNAQITGFSVTVDVEAWKRVKLDHPRPKVIEENPYKTALQELIFVIAKQLQAEQHKIRFVCDHDERADVYQQVYSNFRLKNPETAKKIARSLLFVQDEASYGIQAADLIAHAINQAHQKYGLSGRNEPPPDDLLGVMSGVHIWDYDYGMAVLDAQTM
jgi:hypothetical protein